MGWRLARSERPNGCVLKTVCESTHKTGMNRTDFIKGKAETISDADRYILSRLAGKADIFSFVMDVMEGIHKNGQRVTCGEIVDRIERYVNTPLRDPASAEYHAGVSDAVAHFRGYFVPREDVIDSDAARYVYKAVEERWEELYRQLDAAGAVGPKMTLGELWATATTDK